MGKDSAIIFKWNGLESCEDRDRKGKTSADWFSDSQNNNLFTLGKWNYPTTIVLLFQMLIPSGSDIPYKFYLYSIL